MHLLQPVKWWSPTKVLRCLDPIDMEIKNKDGGLTKPRLNIGFRFKLSIITIHFDYTRANYNVFTAGFGVSWR